MFSNPDFPSQISCLKLATARLARKLQNYRLAENLLIDEVYNSLNVQSENEHQDQLESISDALTKLYTCNGTMDQIKLIRIEREGAKLLHSKGQPRDAIDTLVHSIYGHAEINAMANPISAQSKDVLARTSDYNARSLLTAVQWLQQDHKHLSVLASQMQGGQGDEGNTAAVTHNLKMLLELEYTCRVNGKGIVLDEAGHEGMHDCSMRKLDPSQHCRGFPHLCLLCHFAVPQLGDHPLLTDSDRVVGQLLNLSAIQAPGLSKAWFALGGWCYKWGRKALDSAGWVAGFLQTSRF